MEKQLPYTSFSKVYDATMKKVPYAIWADYIYNNFKTLGVGSHDRILEIACGTGKLFSILNKMFLNLTGLDLSFEMLQRAREKKIESLINADMMSMPYADQCFSAIYATHDSLNYLTNIGNIKKHFAEARRVLKKGGYYIFDLSTEYNVLKYYHEKTIKEDHNGIEFLWHNFYDVSKNEIISTLEFFNKRKNERNSSFLEIHRQKIFYDSEIINAAEESKFALQKRSADYSETKSLKKAQLMVYHFRKE
ncbi:MAG: class I SAM-dependent methyltransferase [Spirochaetia bacterium]|nr:class I SAM-dependent methyltransferase [Spirochaetia bacterium]